MFNCYQIWQIKATRYYGRRVQINGSKALSWYKPLSCFHKYFQSLIFKIITSFASLSCASNGRLASMGDLERLRVQSCFVGGGLRHSKHCRFLEEAHENIERMYHNTVFKLLPCLVLHDPNLHLVGKGMDLILLER